MKAGWQVKTLGEVCEVVNGGTPKTGVKEYWGGEHLWITPAEMGKRLSPYADDTARKITQQGCFHQNPLSFRRVRQLVIWLSIQNQWQLIKVVKAWCQVKV